MSSQFEIPDSMREMMKTSIEQTRKAFDQFMAAARQAQSMLAQQTPGLPFTAQDIQNRITRITTDNVNSGFAIAAELAGARNLTEWIEIQQRHSQTQIKHYTEQAEELGRLMAQAAKPRG